MAGITVPRPSGGVTATPARAVRAPGAPATDHSEGNATIRRGQQIASISGALIQRHEQLSEIEDKRNYRRQVQAFQADAEKYLHEPETGYYSKKGEDALGGYKEAQAGLKEIAGKYRGELTGRALEWYDEDTTGKLIAYNTKVGTYGQQEGMRAYTAGLDSQIGAEIEQAVTFHDDPVAFNNAVTRAHATIEERGRALGKSSDTVKEERLATTSAIREEVVRTLATQDGVAAEEYYHKYKEEILGSRYNELDAVVETASVRAKGERLAAAVFNTDTPINDLTAAIRSTDTSQKVKDEAISRVTKMRDEQNAGKAEQLLKDSETEWSAVMDGANPKSDANRWARLDARTKLAVEKYAKTKAKGEQPNQNWEHWTDVALLPDAELVKRDIYTEDRNSLDDAHFGALVTLKRQAQDALDRAAAGASKKKNSLNKFRTPLQMAKDRLTRMGVTTKSKKGLETREQVFRAIEEEIEWAEADGELTLPQIREIVTRNTIKVTIDQPWHELNNDYTLPLALVDTAEEIERGLVKVKDIPTADAAELRTKYEARGVKLEDEQLERIYALIKMHENGNITTRTAAAEINKVTGGQ